MSDTNRSAAGTNWSARSGGVNKSGQNTARDVESFKDKVGDALDRGKSSLANSASTAGDSLSDDVAKFAREDMAAIQKTLSKFASQAGGEAVKTAQNVGSAVASQVGDACAPGRRHRERIRRSGDSAGQDLRIGNGNHGAKEPARERSARRFWSAW